MAVVYAAADGFPYTCTLYTCTCGSRATKHGWEAGDLPDGWAWREADGALAPICRDCAPLSLPREPPEPARRSLGG